MSTCCDLPMAIDSEVRGTTCGGLAVVGGLRCATCGVVIVKRGVTRAATAADTATTWTIAGSGTSLNCGGVRLRIDGKRDSGAAAALMLRLVQLPQLEAEVVRLRAALAGAGACGQHLAVDGVTT